MVTDDNFDQAILLLLVTFAPHTWLLLFGTAVLASFVQNKMEKEGWSLCVLCIRWILLVLVFMLLDGENYLQLFTSIMQREDIDSAATAAAITFAPSR